jgi:glycine oxidase
MRARMSSKFDLIIVGAGIIGSAIAETMRDHCLRICLIDARPSVGLGASAAAIGGITPQSGEGCLGPLGTVAQHSMDLYPAWLRRISAEVGAEIPVLTTGQLQIAFGSAELERLHDQVMPGSGANGAPVLVLSRDELLAQEPLVSSTATGALLLPAELAIEPSRLMAALRQIMLRDARVTLLLSSTAAGISSDPHGARVTLTDGRELYSDQVVVAAGHSSNALIGFPSAILFPVKGQALEFTPPPGMAHRLRRQCYARIELREGLNNAYGCHVRTDG